MRVGSLIADANGDLFGTTEFSGPGGFGTMFEVVKTADRLRQHAHHTGQHRLHAEAGLIADANGDLFGTNQTIGG